MQKRRGAVLLWVIIGAAIALTILVLVAQTALPANTAATPDSVPTPEANRSTTVEGGVNGSDEWEPDIRDFNGVQMALVPAGCFMMGSEDGFVNEEPVHEICFDEPFWIDVYEVTNGQYGFASQDCLDQSSGDDQPRICITKAEAVAHCESRGARLPTEAEWEYAARGPDSLVYSWGNDFVADNVVYVGNSAGRTAPVGSKAGGISWIGAYDLSGNVWEWVSSIHMDYPYNPHDGREVVGDRYSDIVHGGLVRGGSWDSNAFGVRAAYRLQESPTASKMVIGFRCARSSQQ